VTQVKFLGYLVLAESTQPLPDKIEAIKNLSKLKTIKQLRQFLGTLNFYRRFSPSATKDLAKLNDVFG